MDAPSTPQLNAVEKPSAELLAAVRRLPDKPWFNVVWRKGAITQSGEQHRGKAPYQGPYKRRTPEQCAILLEKRPQDFAAVSVALGPDTGLVCCDIDTPAGFQELEHRNGFSRERPYVTSKKPANTCFKSFYRVPEEQWEGLNEVDAGAYQFLWHGNIAVILGEYPGSSCGTFSKGVYALHGDLLDAPEVPLWVLEEMRGRTIKESAFSKALSRVFTSYVANQTDEEAAEFIRLQLQYIHPHGTLPEAAEGAPRKFWLMVGMAIHNRLPGEGGLELWREWSKRDTDYEAEWASGQAERYLVQQWGTFRQDGGRGRAVTPGTLFWLAERNDPERKRFPAAQREQIHEVVEKARQDARSMKHAELIAQLETLYEQHAENASLITYGIQEIAMEHNRSVSGIMSVWAAHQQSTLQERTGIKSPEDLCSLPEREYLVPGLIQKASVYVLAGAPGAGKTSFCGALARTVLHGSAMEVQHVMRPVRKGRVLWVSSDMNDQEYRDVLLNAGLMGHEEERGYYAQWEQGSFDYWPGFQWTMNAALEKRIQRLQPDLVIIDSLASCNRTTGVDENSQAIANPLYELQQMALERQVTFFVLHHLNKSGELRGSSAISAASSAVWNVLLPTQEQCAVNELDIATDRIISPGSKNRGVDQKLLCRIDRVRDVLTLMEFYERRDGSRAGRTCFDRVLNLLDTSGPHTTGSLCEVIGDEFSRKAIEKALLKAREAGLIGRVKRPGKGAPFEYKSLSRGECVKVGINNNIPVIPRDLPPTR